MEQVNTTLVAVVIYLPQDPTLPHAWGYVGVGGGGSLDSLGPHAGRPHGAHIRQERTEARIEIHATHHPFAVYYYDNTTQLLHTHIAYYHYYTPKFPSHTVGVPPAGSFYRFKLLSQANHIHDGVTSYRVRKLPTAIN